MPKHNAKLDALTEPARKLANLVLRGREVVAEGIQDPDDIAHDVLKRQVALAGEVIAVLRDQGPQHAEAETPKRGRKPRVARKPAAELASPRMPDTWAGRIPATDAGEAVNGQ